MSKFTVTQSHHQKKGIAIWLVKPTDKLDYSDYKKLESQIKVLGGYYSRFVKAFVFETEPSIDKLNEAFGDSVSVSDKVQSAGVPAHKLALITLGGRFTSIDKRMLKREYDARKLLVAQRSYFDGMYDTTRSVPEAEMKWSDRDAGFEREFLYSRKPYVSGDRISLGDYVAKYKDDITIPVVTITKTQKSSNYYVDLEEVKVNADDKFEIETDDSDRTDLAEGDRVIMSIYGNKYCGFISNKRISSYTISSWTMNGPKKEEVKEDVNYRVQLDNGVVRSMAHFQLDKDNQCDEISADAIFYKKDYMLPEQFWSSEIVNKINSINSLRRQKASRKKQEYALQDQRYIDSYEKELFTNFGYWLGWEQKNQDYSRKITGETEEEQMNRGNKWVSEFGVQPIRLIRPKNVLINKLIHANKLLLN